MIDSPHFLSLVGVDPPAARFPCLVLIHNELAILPDFLRHYRAIGVDRFYIVDDRSTDGTGDFLSAQPDVTLYTPAQGSTYRRDKRFWRAQILDRYCQGGWVLVPDADEHLVFRDIDSGRDLQALVQGLEAEGAEALHATMLDMYGDMPMAEQEYSGGRLIDRFPLFDGPDHYFRMAVSWRTNLHLPTPGAFAFGGMRQRLFAPLPIGPGSSALQLLRCRCDIGGNFVPGGLDRLGLLWARFRLRRVIHAHKIYNNSKLVLLKWRKGMLFHGGAHAVNVRLNLSQQRGALLHFKFAAGFKGLSYIAKRQQHADGSAFYKFILDQWADDLNPRFTGSLVYKSSESLGRFLN